MRKRKVKLKDGQIQSFYIKGEKNPCNCGCNYFHKQNDNTTTYGVCNSCGKDIYIYKEKEEFAEWIYKKG